MINAQYQFVADISIHCCGESGNLADRGFKRDATNSASHAFMTLRLGQQFPSRRVVALSSIRVHLCNARLIMATHSETLIKEKTQGRHDLSKTTSIKSTISFLQIQTPLCPAIFNPTSVHPISHSIRLRPRGHPVICSIPSLSLKELLVWRIV